jgi:hypothetical protein
MKTPRHCERKRSNPSPGKLDCFVACAPLRKRFAFVAGNDGCRLHDAGGGECDGNGGGSRSGGGGLRQAPALRPAIIQ